MSSCLHIIVFTYLHKYFDSLIPIKGRHLPALYLSPYPMWFHLHPSETGLRHCSFLPSVVPYPNRLLVVATDKMPDLDREERDSSKETRYLWKGTLVKGQMSSQDFIIKTHILPPAVCLDKVTTHLVVS